MATVDADQEMLRVGEDCEEKIFVSVRLRPLNEKEIAWKDTSDWECYNDNTIILKNANLSLPDRPIYPTTYTFDRVFSCETSTRQVYAEGAKKVALSVVSGINSSVFAYGQTSSGKTYTMTGITQYTISDIYDYIEKHKEREFCLKFSAMEIYNESVRDLLSADISPLRLLDDPVRGTVVEKLTEETLRDWNHLLRLLSICEAQRQIGETALNETSSRSHQIIRLVVESSPREFIGRDDSSTLMSYVNFVDLAGSERASQSLSAGTRLKEGCHINRSLLTLGTVIRKLSKGRTVHIPFRDSKLTRILQSSLGGNARTAIICTISPARSHVEQSRNTLLFASCAKEVTTNAQVNVFMSDKALITHLQRELARLEIELRSPGLCFGTSKYVELLREKELQMEKMEKEINELTVQRDIAQSQVQELLDLVTDDKITLIRTSSEPPNWMPKMSVLPEPYFRSGGFQTFCTSQYADEHSGDFPDECYTQLPNSKDNNTSTGLLVAASNFTESNSCHDDIEEQSNVNSDDLCKEVQCIEVEDLSIWRHAKSSCEFSRERPKIESANRRHKGLMLPTLMKAENVVLRQLEEHKELASEQMKEEVELVLCPLKIEKKLLETSSLPENEKYVLPHLVEFKGSEAKEGVELGSSPPQEEKQLLGRLSEEDRKLDCTLSFGEKSSPIKDLTEKLADAKSTQLIRSRSCKARLASILSSSWSENVENCESTPPNESLKDFHGRPRRFLGHPSWFDVGENCRSIHSNGSGDINSRSGSFQCQTPELDNGACLEKLSRNESRSPVGSAVGIILETHYGKSSKDENVGEMMTGLQNEEQAADVDSSPKAMNKSVKDFKDVGLDPIEDDSKPFRNWPSKFRSLQREIIELWHICNAPLLHRTCFFLLFNGEESTDSIYMKVELRRLTYLNDAFSRGIKTMEEGHSLSLASRAKTLHRDRKILSKQMKKKLSEQDREGLYVKWNIGLGSRDRRLQLAYRLWSRTEDMDHIKDSALLVAKLIGFNAPVQASKEMFRLNFDAQTSRSFSKIRRSLLPLL